MVVVLMLWLGLFLMGEGGVDIGGEKMKEKKAFLWVFGEMNFKIKN